MTENELNEPIEEYKEEKHLLTKDNNLYINIFEESKKIYKYLNDSISNFHSIFNKNLNSFEEVLIYLKEIDIPNNCICAAYVGEIPGWRCYDCSRVNNSVICHKCYTKSKNLHKNHHVTYETNGEGMCDCGDPNVLKTFCSEHKGPFKDRKEINEYIEKEFEKNILINLKKFFDEFFTRFSEFLILTENFKYFFNDIFNEDFQDNENDEKKDVTLIRQSFIDIFTLLLNFLLLISENNKGMLHLLSTYFIKNFVSSQQIDDKFKTEHSCIIIEENDVKILNNEENKKHTCYCPFIRLFLTNWREDIESQTYNYEQFLYSFVYNLPLKRAVSIIFYFNYKHITLNNNFVILNNINQFLIEDVLIFLSNKTNFIENSYNSFYDLFYSTIKSPKAKINYENTINKLCNLSGNLKFISMAYSHPKIRTLMTEKTSIIKRIIDCFCLIHNKIEFKSIFPHPPFQLKTISENFFILEKKLIDNINEINLFTQWEKYTQIKEIFKYIINKIINQKSEQIKQIEKNEYSFHLGLYRCFGLLINFFCFNFSLKNKCNLFESIQYFKKSYFNSLEELERFINIIINDYFKFFGFISGIKNSFFNYYSLHQYLSNYFEELSFLKIDFTLIKYLLVMTEKPIDINTYLEKANLENCYLIFEQMFYNNKEETLKEDIKDDFKNIINQWRFLLDLLIILIRDNSTPFLCFMDYYLKCHSLETQKDLFNNIKNNNYIINDMKNIFKVKMVNEFVIKGNLCNLKGIKTSLNSLHEYLFEENYFNKTLDELTLNKLIGEDKLFYLKDSSFKYLDMNYFLSPNDKTEAEKYILDFKKDIVKLNNKYFFNPSMFSFDFFQESYDKIFKNKKNLEIIMNIINKLYQNEINNNISSEIDAIKISFLPVLLDYLLIFGNINTKSMIIFKISNKEIVDKIHLILNEYIKIIKNNELEENIKEILYALKTYEKIYNNINGDFTKLKEYDYNFENIGEVNKNENKKDKQDKKIISKNLKNKFKQIIKNKNNNFEKLNEDIINLSIYLENDINKGFKEDSKNNENIICPLCRNYIKINSFEEPYGTTAQLISDYFYINSVKASIRAELSKFEDSFGKRNILEVTQRNNVYNDMSKRLFSCGHYFHYSCYLESLNNNNYFVCPLCLKGKTILFIPPLNNFQNKYEFLKSEKISEIFNTTKEHIRIEDSYKFKDIVLNFLDIKEEDPLIHLFKDIFIILKQFFVFLENIFFAEGSKFYKEQQINIIKNFILSWRYLIKTDSIQIKKNEFVNEIKNNLDCLVKGPKQEENILFNYENFFYINCYEKIIIHLLFLFDYNEIKEVFKYIIYLIMPYFSFGLYLRYLIYKNDFYSLYDENMKDNINIDNLIIYLKSNNSQLIDVLHSLLQKLILIKLISNFNDINCINDINNYNELSTKQLFSLLEMNFENKLIEKENLNFFELLENLPKSFNENEVLYKEYGINFNYIKIYEALISSLKKYKYEKYIIKKEFIIHFTPIKFQFIDLDNNIFDWVEKNAEKKCSSCLNYSKFCFICLICGKKFCHKFNCNKYLQHTFNCGGEYCVFIDMDNMKLYPSSLLYGAQLTYPLYINNEGVGPNERSYGREFNLNKEKMKLTLKNFVCNNIFK